MSSEMSIGSQQGARHPPGTIEPVAPSPVVRILIRPMTKLLNPLIRKFAGWPHFRMAAQIQHVGRRSGRTYLTPASARLSDAVILIPLTFGNQSDWSRYVRVAGGCSVRLKLSPLTRDLRASRVPRREPLR